MHRFQRTESVSDLFAGSYVPTAQTVGLLGLGLRVRVGGNIELWEGRRVPVISAKFKVFDSRVKMIADFAPLLTTVSLQYTSRVDWS